MHYVWMFIVGIIVGALARWVMPGADHMGLIMTGVLGIVGSFVGGFLQRLIFGHSLEVRHFHPAGIIGSIIGAIVLLLILRFSGLERGRGRSRSRTSGRRRWI